MKKLKTLVLFMSVSLVSLTSCSDRKELYEITDDFVETLSTAKESYNVFKSGTDKKKTSDGRYQVMPSGRLIIVKFLNPSENEKYEQLKDDLKDHYSGDKRVNDVYINRGGTVVVDCRR
jgi:hypothetical protein